MKPIQVIFLSALVAFVVSYGTVKLIIPKQTTTSQALHTPDKKKVFDRVIDTKTLRCGYVAYAPYIVKDPNTNRISGIFYDLTEKMASMAGLQVEWTYETSFATYIEDMKFGRYDVYCGGLWPEANRSLQIDYSNPVNYVGLGVYVRGEDVRFDGDPAKLNNPQYSLATLDGEMSDIVAKADFPKAQHVSHPALTDISQLILAVVTNKADAVVIERAVANEYLKRHPGSLKNLNEKEPLRVFSNTWAVLKGETEILSAINTTLDEMNRTGVVNKVMANHEDADINFYSPARPYEVAY